MIKTMVSIGVTLAVIIGLSVLETLYVQNTFQEFSIVLQGLYDKTVSHTATKQDGFIVQEYWEDKKHVLHVWIPHTAIAEVNYQLDEAVGFLISQDYVNVLPKLEILLCICEDVPRSYSFGLESIF